MKSIERVGNICLLDTLMFGFDRYNAAYLVKGAQNALVDTGGPGRWETVRTGLASHGVLPSQISHVFITHTHADHCGNVAPLLRESPDAYVYVHPSGVQNLTDPAAAKALRKKIYNRAMFARLGDVEPVPEARIRPLRDGDVFPLGAGSTLRVVFAPGHQPEGIVMLHEETEGAFINDLVGNCLPDADAHYALNPPGSDHAVGIDSLRSLRDLPLSHLYMGHFGIAQRPRDVISRAIAVMQELLDIGAQCLRDGTPELIGAKVTAATMVELEKLRSRRGESLFEYASREHLPSQLGYPARASFAGNDTVLHIPLAVYAGLGELSRMDRLMTKRYGPRVRLCTVTTDLPLEVDHPVDLNTDHFCDSCNKCAINCPARAIPSGGKSEVNGVRKWVVDGEACYRFFRKQPLKWGDCIRCVAVCPRNKPDTAFHRSVGSFVARATWPHKALRVADDAIYGRKPRAKAPPWQDAFLTKQEEYRQNLEGMSLEEKCLGQPPLPLASGTSPPPEATDESPPSHGAVLGARAGTSRISP